MTESDTEVIRDATIGKRPGRVLALVLAAQFMALLDIFIVNVAAPTIRSELGASGAGLQLIVAGCTITYAVLLITGARLGGLLGHGQVHPAGLAVFTAASPACGFAAGTGLCRTRGRCSHRPRWCSVQWGRPGAGGPRGAKGLWFRARSPWWLPAPRLSGS
ncbi:hypothetical protein [Streptomyces sp. NPDC002785]|uniref:hypothetical protein n=1 Tax=Streptomyces sp. NPDC002785 TaxID=3154543 RepID=UPI00331FDF12